MEEICSRYSPIFVVTELVANGTRCIFFWQHESPETRQCDLPRYLSYLIFSDPACVYVLHRSKTFVYYGVDFCKDIHLHLTLTDSRILLTIYSMTLVHICLYLNRGKNNEKKEFLMAIYLVQCQLSTHLRSPILPPHPKCPLKKV